MKELRDRVAVVTGGASGVGRALARAFVGEGMKVVLADVEAPALEATAEALSAAGGEVSGVVTDVSSAESVQELADRVYAEHGACHLLCNNAGVSVANLKIWETTPNDWKWVHGVNIHGVIHGIQAFVPRMIEAGQEGFVMNTGFESFFCRSYSMDSSNCRGFRRNNSGCLATNVPRNMGEHSRTGRTHYHFSWWRQFSGGCPAHFAATSKRQCHQMARFLGYRAGLEPSSDGALVYAVGRTIGGLT